MKYTDLCARLERADEYEPLGHDAWEAAAAIRELEAQVRESALQELASLGQAQEAYEAQLAAEAKVGELTRERDAATWQGPGEKPHAYSPDYMAMGDCRICGHTREAHAAIRKGATP